MAIYAIGDIHGCLDALKSIFNRGTIQKTDTVVFLGDYVDRGPDSKGVLDWLLHHSTEYHFEFILGNHDIMMQASQTSKDHLADWLFFGGTATLDSYGIGDDSNWVSKIDPSHWAFMEACRPYHEIGDFIFVHAGLESGKVLQAQNQHHLFWQKFETPEEYAPDKTVICGHTSRKNGEIADFGHTICIDTYAYGGQWLTCLNVGTREFIQANNEGQVKTGKL